MEISREQVLHIARLARIRLDEDKIDAHRNDLNSILQYVDKLAEVDTDGVEPTTHAVPLGTSLREDVVEERLSHEDIVANAPAVEGGHFRVPKVVED
ncbi:MAG: Asp-tRNA(Asn)/Glu-tRNA(Gln) amidotransferase subunit GatC [Bradymonadaceae bacterium]